MKKFKIDKSGSRRFVAIAVAFTMFISGLSFAISHNLKNKQKSYTGTKDSISSGFVDLTDEQKPMIKNSDGKEFAYDENLDTYIQSDSVGMYEKDDFGHILTKDFYESIFVFDSDVNEYLHFYDYGKYRLNDDGKIIRKDNTSDVKVKSNKDYASSNNGIPIVFNSYSDYEKWALNNFSGYTPFNNIMVDDEVYNEIMNKVQDEVLEEYNKKAK